MPELGGNRRSVLDAIKNRLQVSPGVRGSQTLLSADFVRRVGTPALTMPKTIKLDQIGTVYRRQLLRMVDRLVAETLISTAEMVMRELSYTAPVYTATWVPNYTLSFSPNARFNQRVGYWPFKVSGTPREMKGRRKPVRRLEEQARSFVMRAANLKGNYVLFLMNPTPYRKWHGYYLGGEERGAVQRAKQKAQSGSRRAGRRLVRLIGRGRD